MPEKSHLHLWRCSSWFSLAFLYSLLSFCSPFSNLRTQFSRDITALVRRELHSTPLQFVFSHGAVGESQTFPCHDCLCFCGGGKKRHGDLDFPPSGKRFLRDGGRLAPEQSSCSCRWGCNLTPRWCAQSKVQQKSPFPFCLPEGVTWEAKKRLQPDACSVTAFSKSSPSRVMLTGVALAPKSRQRRPPFRFSSCLRARSSAVKVGNPLGLKKSRIYSALFGFAFFRFFPFPTFSASSETQHLFVISFERFLELLRLCFDAAEVASLRETSISWYWLWAPGRMWLAVW